MPAVQTSYLQTIAALLPGQVANAEPNRIVSRTIGANSTTVAFGSPVFRGATDYAVLGAGASGAGAFVGIALIGHEVRPLAGSPDVYQSGDVAAIGVRGVYGVTVASNVTAGAAAYYTAAGAWTATSSGNTAVPGGTFDNTVASGGVAKLRIG